jgi:nicotinamide-nucleotide amidase
MKKNALKTSAVIAIGDEMLLAGRIDTNGPAIDSMLLENGLEPAERLILPDNEQAVAEAVRALSRKHALVLCCGGLGPTQDDVTRQAVARALRRPLEMRPEWLKPVVDYFRKLRRDMPEVNKIQAMLPRGSRHLINHWGTAQGFALSAESGHWVAALPGPPRECLPMLREVLLPVLRPVLKLKTPLVHRLSLRTCGDSESRLQEKLGPLFQGPGQPELGFLLDEPGEILVLLTVRGLDPNQSAPILKQAARQVRKALGNDLVDSRAKPLALVIGGLLKERRETLAVAESCTGGLISRRLTAMAGSSNYFLEGAVTYSNAAKTRRLGVPSRLLAEHGAVSAATAAAMAAGIRKSSQADWGLAVTGIAGPAGGTREKPVGLVFGAVAGPGVQETVEWRFPGERDFIQRRSATLALDLLRRALVRVL